MGSHSRVEEALLELSLTRRVRAPIELVFRAWTDAKQLAKWWGPKGFTNPRCEADARIGGAIRIDMCAPDGVVYPMIGRFLAIDWPHRLVFKACPVDEEGKPYMEVLNTVTFVEVEGGTEIALVARVVKTTPDAPRFLAGMSQGWSQSLDRLSALVAADARVQV